MQKPNFMPKLLGTITTVSVPMMCIIWAYVSTLSLFHARTHTHTQALVPRLSWIS